MSGIRFSDDFKKDAVSQVINRGYSVREVAERLGVITKSLYTWKAQFSKPDNVIENEAELASELRRVKGELIRVTEERDILKEATAYFARETRRSMLLSMVIGLSFPCNDLCRMLRVYFSKRVKEDLRQTALIEQAWKDSGKVYGYRKLHDDLCDQGEVCSPSGL